MKNCPFFNRLRETSIGAEFGQLQLEMATGENLDEICAERRLTLLEETEADPFVVSRPRRYQLTPASS